MAESSRRKISVCVIDDEQDLVSVLKEELCREGFDVSTALNGLEGMNLLEQKSFDVCLLDMNMPLLNGMQVLVKASTQSIPTEFIVLTAHANVQTAIECMKIGAYDYVTKPCDIDRIIVLIRKAYEKRRMKQESLIHKRIKSGRDSLITGDAKMLQILKEAEKVSRTDASVLLLGESGTGKELMAEYIHSRSHRVSGPFIAFNSAAIQENLIESELFGYEKGAFTGAQASKEGLFELANGGTIFLDEIGEMPMQMQTKLLRVIENGTFYKVGGIKEFKVDVRVIAATNRDLKKRAKENVFREDLFYRLSSIILKLPPLRERRGDISLLVKGLLASMPPGYKKDIDARAMGLLSRYDWPGNVRELQNVLNRAAILSDSDIITAQDLPPEITNIWCETPQSSENLKTLDAVEKEHIMHVLGAVGGHKTKAAAILGIDVKTLYRKLKEYNLS